MTQTPRLAVVTGASSGIGAATARRLADEGYQVICAARRTDRIEALAAEIGGRAVTCDVSDPADVARLTAEVGDRLDLLVNNAGGALGTETVADAVVDKWRTMYESNVIGALQVTQALLPALRQVKGGMVVFVSSIAGLGVYEGGAGYCAAKHAETVIAETLRLEAVGDGVRVCEIDPGMVHTEEFSLVRLGGDQAAADKVYEGVEEPLVAEDVADAIAWIATRPAHVNVDRLVLKPQAQAAPHKVIRRS
ncbi:SDR family oxidoreductase [Arsenicicoccus dermatophilus]|uniref:SDR family oxidoreductase n=1 Tax=Arsenicicoccus dermatophilus TaxID=1076331 RepID=UPI001F4CDAC2|nr:SDR family oxidoreductase [Arsenicicoccus dermatophilus]MCH8613855.1 SDR family oxidoreductase [Arsenicicoccus dermatophilus]